MCAFACVRVCAVLTMFFVLFCSEPAPSKLTIVWVNEPNADDAAFFAGSGGEEEDYSLDYSLKPETEEYL